MMCLLNESDCNVKFAHNCYMPSQHTHTPKLNINTGHTILLNYNFISTCVDVHGNT